MKRKQMTREEVLAWLKERQERPLYVGSEVVNGMHLSYVNPELREPDGCEQVNGDGKKEQ